MISAIKHGRELYKMGHLIENAFLYLKLWKDIATEKIPPLFLGRCTALPFLFGDDTI